MKKITIVSAVAGCILLMSCKDNSSTSTVECSTITGATFTTNNGLMASMIQSKCSGSSCHSAGGKEAKEFLVSSDYNTIKSFLSKGASSVLNGSMPEGSKLSATELNLWQCWKENGFTQ